MIDEIRNLKRERRRIWIKNLVPDQDPNFSDEDEEFLKLPLETQTKMRAIKLKIREMKEEMEATR